MNPAVFSIIMPTYRRPSLLKRALKSVQRQTFPDWECLVSNGYPEDNAGLELLIRDLGDPRIKLLNGDLNLGVSANRNRAIKAACGKFLAFLDDDDIWLPEFLQKHLSLHETTRCPGLVYCDAIYDWSEFNLSARKVVFPDPSHDIPLEAIRTFRFHIPCPSSISVHREKVKDVFFDADLQASEDRDYLYQVARAGLIFSHLRQKLLIYTFHKSEKATANLEKVRQAHGILYRKWNLGPEDLYFQKRAQMAINWNSFLTAYISGLMGTYFSLFFHYIRHLPFWRQPRQTIRMFILLFLPSSLYRHLNKMAHHQDNELLEAARYLDSLTNERP